MRIDPDTNIVYIVEDDCIGCGKCAKACKFTPSRIQIRKNKSRKLWKAVKCDLCRDNPEGPQCVKYCIVRCLGLSNDSLELPEGVVPAYMQAQQALEEQEATHA